MTTCEDPIFQTECPLGLSTGGTKTSRGESKGAPEMSETNARMEKTKVVKKFMVDVGMGVEYE